MQKSKYGNWYWRAPLLAALVLSQMVVPLQAMGQESQMPVSPEPIKLGYKSWSLFLVCGPEWLLAENQERLANLYNQFGAFGMAIGPKNLAVWFRKAQVDPNAGQINYGKRGHTLADYVDVSRSSQYCGKFQLLPSKSPHILVTTTYPDLDAKVGDYAVLSLNNATSSDITSLLNKLSDQLLVQGLDQAALNSEEYWRGWQRTYEAIKRSAGSLAGKTKLEINTQLFKLEIDGGR